MWWCSRAQATAPAAALAETAARPGFRGCRYLAADLALAVPDNPAHAVTREYREALHRLLEGEPVGLGHPRPARAADQLLLLIEGVLVAGATRCGAHPGTSLGEPAARVLDCDRRSPG
ncbi:hypothetical protein [Actinomadura sediminis]|uniref:TetR family transcriptional regulator n=1 Tax=Actinomadura sediminis TaxID=1038904 RepID=A0ABW3EKN9_9ACTN